MGNRVARWRIGTSGWNYPHWKGLFYPSQLARARWLEFYAEHFDTVEVNATFYRLPVRQTFEKWRERTPEGFLWSIKASKYITHTKRLKGPREPLKRLYGAVEGLREKAGVILFQLPPSLPFEPERFEAFCDNLNPSFRHVLEIRHPSWIHEGLFRILQDHNMAFCISDTAGRYPYHEAVSADFVYVRLHGSKRLYASKYSRQELEAWARKIKAWDRETFLYFDNDYQGYAVQNAIELKTLLGEGV